MASIFSGLQDLISSIFEIFRGIFSTIVSGFESVLGLFQNLISSIFDLMSGFVGFILGKVYFTCSWASTNSYADVLMNIGNIVIIGVLAAAWVGYSAYRQKHQGGGITAGKKTS